jgi:hypothetical protein
VVVPSPATPVTRPRLRRTSGGTLSPRCDGRKLPARRYRTLVETFEAELGGGPLSAIDTELIRQAAAIALRSTLQTAIVAGESVNADEIIRLSSEFRRILTGLKAKAAKNAPPNAPSPLEYAARKAAEKATRASAGEVA